MKTSIAEERATSEFGQLILSENVSLQDEVRAASLFLEYLESTRKKVPELNTRDSAWLKSELESGDMSRLEYVFIKPEGCFGLFRNFSAEIIQLLKVIEGIDAEKLLMQSDYALEDYIWITITTKLANPIASDILNCPSKHLDSVQPFNPISDYEGTDTSGVVVQTIVGMIQQNFVLNDPRFVTGVRRMKPAN